MKQKKRKPFFLGGEGESEQSYAAFLDSVCKERGLHIHIENKVIAGGGSPERFAKNASQVRGRFVAKAVLLDTDRLQKDLEPHERNAVLKKLADDGFIVIQQNPDHEAFLLTHFPDAVKFKSTTKGMKTLKSIWPEYRKNMPARNLKRKFSLEDIRRAAKQNPELRKFLKKLGLLS